MSTQFKSLPYPNFDFSSRVVIITGANTGLGLEAARHFVRLNAAKVILGCRDGEKGAAAKHDIEKSEKLDAVADANRVEVWVVDFESFDSVKAFVAVLKRWIVLTSSLLMQDL